MNPTIQKFIEENIGYIEAENFDVVYARAMSIRSHKVNIGELTDVFYDAGIDPLASLTEIPAEFLDGSKITAIVVPENIKIVHRYGFAFSNLDRIELHESCELSEDCFYASKIHSIMIPYIMNEVPNYCFYLCTQLSKVDLNNIDQIGEYAFSKCKNLKQLFIPDDIGYIADTAFDECPVTLLFHSNNDYAIEYCHQNNMEYKFV